MDIRERVAAALAKLGPGARIAEKRKPKGRPRKPSSMVKGLSKHAPALKDRYRQCYKKRRYKSEHDARLSANNCMAKRGKPLRVYRCPVCNGWHITGSIRDEKEGFE